VSTPDCGVPGPRDGRGVPFYGRRLLRLLAFLRTGPRMQLDSPVLAALLRTGPRTWIAYATYGWRSSTAADL